jgi:hypothetical protein
MEIIIIMWITQIIIIAISFISMMIIFDRLANKLLQIEIIKKAENFKEAKEYWKKDINVEQKKEKKIIDEQEKSFLEYEKIKKNAELEKEKEEEEWKNV